MMDGDRHSASDLEEQQQRGYRVTQNLTPSSSCDSSLSLNLLGLQPLCLLPPVLFRSSCFFEARSASSGELYGVAGSYTDSGDDCALVACGFGKLVIESKILGEVIDPILLSLAPLQDQLVKFDSHL